METLRSKAPGEPAAASSWYRDRLSYTSSDQHTEAIGSLSSQILKNGPIRQQLQKGLAAGLR